jgi:nitroreductase
MSLNDALNWRYATKRMTGAKIPKVKFDAILNAIALAPSSFGLQPYSILIIDKKSMLEKIKPIAMMQPQITEASALLVFAAWEKVTQEKIDIYFKQIASERKVTQLSLKPIKAQIEKLLKNSETNNFNWSSKQTYIALGIGITAAADQAIDATPMEGFDKNLLDELLDLKKMGLKSIVLMTLGYRDIKNDYLVKLKKVRRPKEKLFIKVK